MHVRRVCNVPGRYIQSRVAPILCLCPVKLRWLSGRQLIDLGPSRHELWTIGMLSAIGKLHTSLTSRPSRSVIHALRKRPQGTAYENGRWSASMMTKFPSGEGSSRVCIAGPEPNSVFRQHAYLDKLRRTEVLE